MGALLDRLSLLGSFQAEQLGSCPCCSRTLAHWRGRHTGRWTVWHPMAMCPLADKQSAAGRGQDEARDAWLGRSWIAPIKAHLQGAIAKEKRARKGGRP